MLKLAVVGGGPSAFYVASRLLQLIPPSHRRANDLRIHIYDRLWAPHGLVRYGVAPDHPEVKNCTHKFDAAAADPRLKFFGNVHIGTRALPAPPHALPLALPTLLQHYTHLLLAPGAPLPRAHPSLPPPLARPALDLVHWYTAHPCAPAHSPLPRGVTHITIIGHGNVALDIARLLLTPPSVLATRDVPAHVLAALTEAWRTLRHISIVGRRGPREARFTAKELREMMHLEHARMCPIPAAVLDADDTAPPPTRQEARILQLLREGSTRASPAAAPHKTFSLEFWSSAVARDGALLTLADTAPDPRTRARTLRTDLVIASLGYSGDPAVFAADEGPRDTDPSAWLDGPAEGGRVRGGVYVSGWAAHGARGVLAGTMMDAYAVAAAMLEDRFGGGVRGMQWVERGDEEEGRRVARGLWDGADVRGGLDGAPDVVERGVSAGDVLTYGAWRRVEAEERRRGGAAGKERERMASWTDVRAFLGR